jgi:O-methyltransferase
MSMRNEAPTMRPYDEEAEAINDLRLVAPYTTNTFARAMTLWQQVRYVDREGIQGALVECGVQHGAMPALMALAHRHAGTPTRMIHLFDSFEGLPEPDTEKDGTAVRFMHALAEAGKKPPFEDKGRLIPIGVCVSPIENAERLMQMVGHPAELTAYHKGWVQDTLPPFAASVEYVESNGVDGGKIAILRLDVDLYDATAACLKYLAPFVADGGFIIEDDMGHLQGAKRAVDEYMAAQPNPKPFIHHIDKCARYWQVRR